MPSRTRRYLEKVLLSTCKRGSNYLWYCTPPYNSMYSCTYVVLITQRGREGGGVPSHGTQGRRFVGKVGGAVLGALSAALDFRYLRRATLVRCADTSGGAGASA